MSGETGNSSLMLRLRQWAVLAVLVCVCALVASGPSVLLAGDAPAAPQGAGGAAMPSDQPGSPGAQALYDEARRTLAGVSSTRYAHTYVADRAAGRYELNCSGFVSLLLGRVNPAALATLDRSGRHRRPRAEDYHRSIQRAGLIGDGSGALRPEQAGDGFAQAGDGSGWLRVERAADLRPGDVVAWLRPATRVTGSATGHVMVVMGSPRVNPARPTELLLPVADSTLNPHGGIASAHDTGNSNTEGDVAARSGAASASRRDAAIRAPREGRASANAPAFASVPHGVPQADSAWLASLPKDNRLPGTGGVGTGVIGLATDAQGRPVAFWWHGGVSRRAQVTSIMLGRLR